MNNICEWIDSPNLSDSEDNDLDTGFGGQLNCGLKLEEGLEFVEPLTHNSPPDYFYRDAIDFNRNPKTEPKCSESNPDTQIDIYRDLILRQLISDFSTTSSKLSLPTDPTFWSVSETSRWLKEQSEQFNIRVPENLNICGKDLMFMSQEEFCAKIPEGGDTLFAQFSLWKTAFESHNEQKHPASVSLINKPRSWDPTLTDSESAAPASHPMHGTNINSAIMPSDHSYYSNYNQQQHQSHQQHQNQHQMHYQPTMINPQHPVYSPFHCNESAGYYMDYPNPHTLASPSNSEVSSNSSMIDEDPRFEHRGGYGVQSHSYFEMPQNTMNLSQQQHSTHAVEASFGNFHGNTTEVYSNNPAYSKNNSGTIHLWVFIRELLDNKEYSNCVRWVDRNEGTFKIESSHNLARLWGLRKNRSAMNYDKLSRSLRQYYKKRIIQKPEKKQRLVYKFLPPYNSFTH